MKIPRLSSLFYLMVLACTAQAFAEKPAVQTAIIQEIRKTGATYTLQLDFVEIRDCNCDAGIEIVNKNPRLRAYKMDEKTAVWLLKSAGEHTRMTVNDLLAGREGKSFGWPFDKSTPFEFRFAAGENRIVELRQVYLP